MAGMPALFVLFSTVSSKAKIGSPKRGGRGDVKVVTKGGGLCLCSCFTPLYPSREPRSDITHLPGYGGGELGQTRSPMCPAGKRMSLHHFCHTACSIAFWLTCGLGGGKCG